MAIYNEIRPHTWGEMIGQDAVRSVLQRQAAAKKLGHAYVLHGIRGGGKTTTARILAMAANCKYVDSQGNPCNQCEDCLDAIAGRHRNITEVDAARNRGVEYADHLIEDTMYPPSAGTKVYIIDEAHMLSKEACNSLLKVMEEPPEYVMFILCTTDLNALPETIKSRAQCYMYSGVDADEICSHLAMYLAEKNISYEPDSLRMIVREGKGSVRDSISVLERCLSLPLTVQNVRDILGKSSIERLNELLLAVFTHDQSGVVSALDGLFKQVPVGNLVPEILEYLSEISLSHIGQGKVLFPEVKTEFILGLFKRLTETLKQVRVSPFPELVIRATLLDFAIQKQKEEDVIARIVQLEEQAKYLEEKLGKLVSFKETTVCLSEETPKPTYSKETGKTEIPLEPEEEDTEDTVSLADVFSEEASALSEDTESEATDCGMPCKSNSGAGITSGSAGGSISGKDDADEEDASSGGWFF